MTCRCTTSLLTISDKELHARNFHHTVVPSFSFFESKFHPEILRCFPRAGALNEGGAGKIGDFRSLSRHISETVQDRTKVAIDH